MSAKFKQNIGFYNTKKKKQDTYKNKRMATAGTEEVTTSNSNNGKSCIYKSINK